MIESKKGMSACEVGRVVKVSYKTAWFLCHRVRGAMREVSIEKLRGIVEVDETYIGGKTRGTGRGYKRNKAIVIGAVQRGGHIRLKVINQANKATLHQFVNESTDDHRCRA